MTLCALLTPHSVAVIGASADAARIGGKTLATIIAAGFTGPLYPVNPKRREIQSLPAYPTIGAVPGPIDCAIIAIPAADVIATLQDCAAHGVRSAIIFSGGFAEAEAAGLAMQAEIAAIAKQTGMRVLGPNCIGLFSMPGRAYLTFFEAGRPTPDTGRNIAIASQSGGYGAHIVKLAHDRGLRVSHCVTTGNEADIEVGDVLLAFAADPAIDVLVAYVEGIRTPGPFIAALDLARRNRKPVVLMKCGYTERGAQAAASHTASMAGADLAYDLVFARYGVHRARSTEEVLDIAYAASFPNWPQGDSVAVLTNSGGIGVQIADFISDAGLDMATVPPATQAAIKALVPQGSPANPVDVTAQWLNDPSLIAACTELLLKGAVPAVLVVFMGASITHPSIRASIATITSQFPHQPLMLVMADQGEDARRYQAMGCLCFEEPARAIRAIAALNRFRHAFDRTDDAPPAPARHDSLIQAGAIFDEQQAKRLLAASGVGAATDRVAATPDEAAAQAIAAGFPVALKILSPDILHKTEIGGVILDLPDEAAVSAAAAAMLARIAAALPAARLDGFLVSPMAGVGIECIIGLQRDSLFGPMIMAGLGGTLTELVQDVAWRLAPVTAAEAEAMLDTLRLGPILRGHRGRPPADVAGLAEAIAALSRLGAANPNTLEGIEVNPLLVRNEGEGVVVLDALVRTVPA